MVAQYDANCKANQSHFEPCPCKSMISNPLVDTQKVNIELDWLSEEKKNYLTVHMKEVSRSFALVYPRVEAPLNAYLATAYLICRVVDNIEDCTQPYAWRKNRFAEFSILLKQPQKAFTILEEWGQYEWTGLTASEQNLMGVQDGYMLWQIYNMIPIAYRQSIHVWSQTMADGMEHVSDLEDETDFVWRRGVRIPRHAADYDQYCFYVAGTVGHMITELALTFYGIDEAVGARLLQNSEACGRALQKTNIIKDFAKDLQRDCSYLPDEWLREIDYAPLKLGGAPKAWKKMVIDDVLCELDSSVNYVVELPLIAAGFRLAGLLMMLPAYQTLLVAAQKQDDLFCVNHHVKISQFMLAQSIAKARLIVNDNDAIRAVVDKLKQTIIMTMDKEWRLFK